MARVPPEVIRSIQDAVDIVDVVSRYVTLKRSGRSFKALCPFHEEKTPSFHVFPESGRFVCFGCGEKGDVFAFLMRQGGLGFRDAVEELARETGVPLPREEAGPEQRERDRRRSEALEALRFAAGFYRAVLGRPTGAPARAYLRERGFFEETLETFGVGFAPDDYEGLLRVARERGLREEACAAAGLVRRNASGKLYDMFRGRIMFPIHDLSGRVIGFGGRALGDAQPKYVNSPDSALFHKGREMYGLNLARSAARREGRLIVVEGYTDVMHCHQAGLQEVAAGLGTAFTPDNARQLRRFGVPVLLLYDGDEAGRRAAERAADVLLEEAVEASVCLLPAGRDPADLVQEGGREALEAALGTARDPWEYRLERVQERCGPTLDGRQKAVEELLGTVERIRDPLRRDLALQLLSERTGVPESTLRDRIDARPGGRGPASGAPPAPPAGWLRAERELLAAGMRDAVLWERIEREYPPEGFRDPDLRRVAETLRDLRRRGQSCSPEVLMGELADEDRAVRALQELDAPEDAVERAEKHLAGIAERRRRESALESTDLEAALRARRGSSQAGQGAR